jgi:hypothetical protein
MGVTSVENVFLGICVRGRLFIATAGFALLVLCTLSVAFVQADTYEDWQRMRDIPRSGYVANRAGSRIEMDGRLDDAAWRGAAWSEQFQDIESKAKPRPRFDTRVKMLWDRKYLYIGAFLPDPHVWGTLTEHDSVIFHDNDFEVFIDPDADNHEYYEFEINALNTGWDLFLDKPYKDGGKADNGWEIPGLKTAIHIEGTLNDPSDIDQYWSVEIAIPWKALNRHSRRRYPPSDGDQWRINFSRVQWKTTVVDGKYQKVPDVREDNWVWSPQGIIDMHRPEKWGIVQFSTQQESVVGLNPDVTENARKMLMEIYHKQKANHRKTGEWWTTLEELGIGSAKDAGVVIEKTNAGYLAEITLPDGRTACVTQDSRLWIK